MPDYRRFMVFFGDYSSFWAFFMLIYPIYLFFSIFSPTSSIGNMEFFHESLDGFCARFCTFYAKFTGVLISPKTEVFIMSVIDRDDGRKKLALCGW